MINDNIRYIHPEVADKIRDAAIIEEVIADFIQLKTSGASKVGDCPGCGAKKKLTVTPSKKIWKCFRCDEGGKDAVSFLTKMQGKTYVEALAWLADRYNIPLEEPTTVPTNKKQKNRKEKFRDAQLRASGIPDKYQQYYAPGAKGASYECDRYQAATLDKFGNVIPGDDMVLHYLDLDGNPITFKKTKAKSAPLIRVRWANPALHLDKNGNPIKYQSPYGSGSHLWIPNWMIAAYKKSEIIETLYVCEGEKKADKMCLSGLPAVGIMGINNLASFGEMPAMFESLIKKCAVANVVFLLDSDWQDISLKNTKAIDNRPKTFLNAVTKFRNYFTAFHHEGYDIRIFLAHGKDKILKGIDDLLVLELQGKEKQLVEDFDNVLKGRTGEGEYVNAYDITGMSYYKLKEFWNLHSIPAFIQAHKEDLKKLSTFKIGKLTRRWNEEEGTFEIDEKILPQEKFWSTSFREDKKGNEFPETKFRYQEMRLFLRNRGFGLYKTPNNERRFVNIYNRIVTEINHKDIQEYILSFLEELNEKHALEMMLKGGTQYLGPNNLNLIYGLRPTFKEPEKDAQYLYFKNVFWKITADGIEEKPIKSLPGNVWDSQVIDFEPKYLNNPMATMDRSKNGWGPLEISDHAKKSDWFKFFVRTSSFHWDKFQQLSKNEDGNFFWKLRDEPEETTDDDIRRYREHMAAKMAATGYILHQYRDYSCLKAIMVMDGLESEVGKSQGGSGKSIWGTSFEYLVPTVVLDGKKKNISDDNFLYDSVDERTQCIVFDDCRVNMDYEHFFSQITRGIQAEKKGVGKQFLSPIRMIFLTNHAPNMEGNSFERRRFLLGFSDYYNAHRTVADDFGHQLFKEWDYQQWNLFYNWMANCIQFYLKHGLSYPVTGEDLERRKLRQHIGENFMEWMSTFIEDDGIMLNKKLEKMYITNRYLEDYPMDKRYINPRKIKEKFIKYAQYAGLEFNPTTDGERLRTGGKEYFILADDKFDANDLRSIEHDSDWMDIQGPF
jgi:DNA primase